MPIVKCKICTTDFYVKPSHVGYGYGKYCSMKCTYEGRKKGKIVSCFGCAKKVYKSQQALGRSKSKKYFCSKSCQTSWRNALYIGSKHTNFIHGKGSYRTVMFRSKIPQICSFCGLDDKRILAVHHLDRDRMHNKVSNLAWLCFNCHFLIHHDNVEEQKFLRKRLRNGA